MNAPILRIRPTCSRPHPTVTPCSRRHPPVRVTRTPTVAEAFARAWDDHRPDDAASVALDALRAELRAIEARAVELVRELDALRAELRAIEARAVELVREPGARGSLRLQTAEEAVLRAADALRVACGVGL